MMDAEYRRNVDALALFRVAGTGLWLAVVLVLPFMGERFAPLAAARPWVGVHVLFAVVMLVGLRRGVPIVRTFQRATEACPDITFLFFSLFAVIVRAPAPERLATFSLALFLAFLLPTPAGARRAPRYTAALLSLLYLSGLLWAAGIRDWTWPVLAAAVLGYAAFFGEHLAGRFRQVAVEYARERGP